MLHESNPRDKFFYIMFRHTRPLNCLMGSPPRPQVPDEILKPLKLLGRSCCNSVEAHQQQNQNSDHITNTTHPHFVNETQPSAPFISKQNYKQKTTTVYSNTTRARTID